jgi:hypothetical protein
MKILREMQM